MMAMMISCLEFYINHSFCFFIAIINRLCYACVYFISLFHKHAFNAFNTHKRFHGYC